MQVRFHFVSSRKKSNLTFESPPPERSFLTCCTTDAKQSQSPMDTYLRSSLPKLKSDLHLSSQNPRIQLLQSSPTTSSGHFEFDDLFDPTSSFSQTQQSGAGRLISYLDAKLGFQE